MTTTPERPARKSGPSPRTRLLLPKLGERRASEVEPDLAMEGYAYGTAPDGRPLLVIGPELDEAWLALYQLRFAREELELFIRRYVALARESGLDWEDIGSALGVSRQTAARGYVGVDDSEADRAWIQSVLEAAQRVRSSAPAPRKGRLP